MDPKPEPFYITPDYQRRAYNKYYAKKRLDEQYIANRKAQQKIYYIKNKEIILGKMKTKYESKKQLE